MERGSVGRRRSDPLPAVLLSGLVERLVVAGVGSGAALAEGLVGAFSPAGLAVVVDAFAALGAGDAGGLVAGHLAGVKGDADPLLGEEVGVGEFAVGEHLLLVLVFDVGIEIAGALLGGLEGGDADGLIGGGFAFGVKRGVEGRDRRSQIEEGGGHLAPVAELEGALAQAAAGDHGDGIGGAAIDLDEGDQALAVFAFGC